MSHFPTSIPCDWGYAFDYLSIFQVKCAKKGDEISFRNYEECLRHIRANVGFEKMCIVHNSKEFAKMLEVNDRLYDLVDKAKKDEVPASEVDRGVWDRYLAKKTLQEKFFPEEETKEQKVGYEGGAK